jgi:hypothetical protein
MRRLARYSIWLRRPHRLQKLAINQCWRQCGGWRRRLAGGGYHVAAK